MSRLTLLILSSVLSPLVLRAATPPSISDIFDNQITAIERDVVPLAEAMPALKFNFAPSKGGAFSDVRSFSLEATHVATVLYEVSSAMLEEKCPVEIGINENGPASLKTKPEIMEYLTGAFAYAHKAMRTLTASNLTEMIQSPFGKALVPRASLASIGAWHTMDHYGQMVVYARMNGIIPPASRH